MSDQLLKKIKLFLKNKKNKNYLFEFKNKDLSKVFKTILQKSGFEKATMNTLRHSVASEPMSNKERVQLAQKMGHSVNTNVSYIRE